MKKTIALIIASAVIFPAFAQYEQTALLFSQTFPSMTARSLSMGGAFMSLGGDMSSVYLNPAGLGIYRKSEFSVSPGIGYVKSSSDFQYQDGDDFRYHFILGNAGYVSSFNSKKEKGLVGGSFGFSYNRLNNFHGNIFIEGENSSSSLIDILRENATGIHPDDLAGSYGLFQEQLAFNAYLIDTVAGSPTSYEDFTTLPVNQRRTVETEGGAGEWALGFGLNFSNVFYFGMGLGINHVNYSKSLIQNESNDVNSGLDFTNFRYTETLDLSGTGVNIKIGFIAKPIPMLRLSGAIHTPVYYTFNEEYEYHMSSLFDDGFNPTVDPIYGEFDYKLTTPLKAMGGVAVQIGKIALVSADVEYVDYSTMRYRTKSIDDDMSEFNTYIQDDYKSVLNLKAGGEIRFGQLAVRAGGAYYPSPYAIGINKGKAAYKEFSGGVGYRDENFYIDLGLSALLDQEKYLMYGPNTIADLNNSRFRFITTFGFRF